MRLALGILLVTVISITLATERLIKTAPPAQTADPSKCGGCQTGQVCKVFYPPGASPSTDCLTCAEKGRPVYVCIDELPEISTEIKQPPLAK